MTLPLLRIAAAIALTLAVCAADEPRVARLKAADDERVAAMMAGDRTRLEKSFSDELRYSHSTGSVDDKKSFIEALTTGRSKYLVINYHERNFTFPAPGIALMTGKAALKMAKPEGTADLALAFLGVWREEQGQWRFLAWQSCKLPDAAPAAK